MTEKTSIDSSTLPQAARNAIARNTLNSPGPWLLINLSSQPPVVLPSGVLTNLQWLDMLDEVRQQVETHVLSSEETVEIDLTLT
jgi:hypothetical protein